MDVQQGQAMDNSVESSPSTSRGGFNRPPSHQCITIWEPVSLKQEWTIANFDKAMDLAAPGMCMRSKPFSEETMPDIHWQLCLYPGGKREENQNNVSLFLKMSSATPKEYTVRAEYKFYFVDETGVPKFSNVNVGDFKVKPQKGSHSWGLRNIPKTKVLPCLWTDKTLRIVCQIELIPEVHRLQTVDVVEKTIDKSTIQSSFITNICGMADDQSVDCKIICEGEEFAVHKFLLMAHSDAFRAMLTHDTIEKRDSLIHMRNGTKAVAVKHLLHYMYSSTLPEEFSDDDATDVMQLADMYHIEPLKLLVQKKLAERLNPSNVCSIFLKAHLYNASQLMDACVPVFFMNSKTIMKSEEYNIFKTEHTLAANCLLEKFVAFADEKFHPLNSPPHKRHRVGEIPARMYF